MRVLSFCLYGGFNKKYYWGLQDNIDYIINNLPDYHIHLWLGKDVELDKLHILDSPRVHIFKLDLIGHLIMFYRFLSIEQKDVDIVFSRDADSRITNRDLWCYNKFINSNLLIHTIRDHKYHQYPLMGGLTGLKKEILKYIPSIQKIINDNINQSYYLLDQQLLQFIIYNNNRDKVLVHATKNIFQDVNFEYLEGSVDKTNFCGQVIDYDQNNTSIYVHDYVA